MMKRALYWMAVMGGISVWSGMAFAAEEAAAARTPVAVTAEAGLFSAYVARGQVINEEAVVQPLLSVTRGGLLLSAWGNVNLTDQAAVTEDAPAFSELDLTLSYTMRAGPVALTGGWVEYVYPNTTVAVTNVPPVGAVGTACRATREVFVTASVPGWRVVPTVTVYRDMDEVDGAYATAGLSWAQALGSKVTLTLGGSVGYGDADYNTRLFGVEKDGWNDGNANASLSWTVTDTLTVTPSIQYTTMLDGDIKDAAGTVFLDDESVWGGVKVSWAM